MSSLAKKIVNSQYITYVNPVVPGLSLPIVVRTASWQYLNHLIEKGRTRSTLRKHGDYLWALGGEIIRDTSESGFDLDICHRSGSSLRG